MLGEIVKLDLEAFFLKVTNRKYGICLFILSVFYENTVIGMILV